MPVLFYVLWLMTITSGTVEWNRFDFYFETQEQCLAAAELIPDVEDTSCLTDQQDAIAREMGK